jgi:hypothetical protein
MDVRDAGTGHVAWIDISKAGEAPKYVTAWPLKDEPSKPEPTKTEPTKQADNTDAAKLPSLPAALSVAPLETPKVAAPAAEPVEATPPKKTHRHHHHARHTDHTI